MLVIFLTQVKFEKVILALNPNARSHVVHAFVAELGIIVVSLMVVSYVVSNQNHCGRQARFRQP